jgi:hypothetical protein
VSEPKSQSQWRPEAGVLGLWPRIYNWSLLVLCAVLTWRPLEGGEDFWAHAAVGRWIWQSQSVPRETLWLWGASPQEWIAHSWLSEVFFYALMRVGGAHLVLLATIVLVFLPFAWLWKLWLRREGGAALGTLYFAFAMTCAAVRFQPRPELLSYFFLTILLLFLIEWPRTEARVLAVKFLTIAALFVLWANCHGGVALGLAVLALTVLGETLQRRCKVRELFSIFGLLALCALAVNFNPYGIGYWKALRPVGGAMFKMIDEWKSPLFAPALPPLAIAFVALIFFVALWAWMRNRERRWSHLLWLLFFGFLFLSARRNLWPTILVCAAVAAANAGSLSTLRMVGAHTFSRPMIFLTRAVVAGVLAMWIGSSFVPQAISVKNDALQLHAVSRFAPEGVALYVLKNHPPGPIFNDYLRSSYFHWRFAGKRKLFIDLQNAYPPNLLAEYFQIIARTPSGIKLFDQKKINTVIFGRWEKKSRVAPLAKYLDADKTQWKRVYSGADGTVWVRWKAF